MTDEVSAWLETLHLSRSIKQPKRDLANGMLAAELLHT